MTYSPPVVINNIDEALRLYNSNLPWEEDVLRARVVLACLEYILINRPQQSQLAQLGLSFERVKDELDRVRGFLGLGDVEHKHFFQRVSSSGIV